MPSFEFLGWAWDRGLVRTPDPLAEVLAAMGCVICISDTFWGKLLNSDSLWV